MFGLQVHHRGSNSALSKNLILNLVILTLTSSWACNISEPLSDARVIVSVFNPSEGEIPMPNDILKDDTTGYIAIPAEAKDLEDKTPIEAAIIHALNQRRGWSTRTTASVEFSGALSPETVTHESIRVFVINHETIRPVDVEIAGEPADAPEKVTITAPEGGWLRGSAYFVAAIGGQDHLRGLNAEQVVADAAFWYLRLEDSLLDRVSAIPGDSAEERRDNAEALEEIRLELAPFFDHLEQIGIERTDVVNLWSFGITSSPEVYMDKDAGKMPLPSDFLRNPGSGLIDLPINADDADFKRDAKEAINQYDGFSLSANMIFEVTAPIDPTTLTPESVRLFSLTDGRATPIEIEVSARSGNQFLRIELVNHLLEPETNHVVVLTRDLQDTAGNPVETMMPGLLAMLDEPLLENGQSTLPSLDSESAAKVEFVRKTTHLALTAIERENLLDPKNIGAAWSFRTLSIRPQMLAKRNAAHDLATPTDPVNLSEKSVFDSILEFPIGIISMFNVDTVFDGQIMMPQFHDPMTRRDRPDGSWELRPVNFTMTIPKNVSRNQPLKVAIYAHPIVTERRFVYAIADALAREGIAGIAIDLPYHGERTHCHYRGPICIVNPLDPDGDMLCPNPCESGTTCADDGRCVDNGGNGNHRSSWPVIPMYQASGAVFLDVNNLAGTRDNFYQAVTDLSALLRSLREGNWRDAIGYDINPDVHFVGQSLGAIVGTLFTAVEPSIKRSVLNVPGGNLVDIFRKSGWFSPHFDYFMTERNIEPGSLEYEQVILLTRWMLDPIDPQTYARFLLNENFEVGSPAPERKVMLQMATLDFIIPNDQTVLLSTLSQVPRYDYLAEHAFLCVPIEPAFYPGLNDVAELLSEGRYP